VWPPAHPAPSPSSPSAAKPARLPYAAGGASAPAAPQGAPRRQKTPARARRNESLAAGRAHAVKAQPYGWRAKSTRASLDSARPAAGLWPPPGRKTGWGKGRATRTRVAVRSSVALPLVAAQHRAWRRGGRRWRLCSVRWPGPCGVPCGAVAWTYPACAHAASVR